MYPNKKSLKVYEIMCGLPNQWVDVIEVAKLANLTARQVATAVQCLPEGAICKERHGRFLQIRLNGTEEELNRNLLKYKAMSLEVTDEMRDRVRGALSTDTWSTISDVSSDTGMDRIEVFHTLQVMAEVNMKYTGKSYLCRIKEGSDV